MSASCPDGCNWLQRLIYIKNFKLFIAVNVVLWAGVLLFVFYENRGLDDGFYIICQLYTTVGYGDLTPKTNALKLYVSFYVISCLVVLAFSLSSVSSGIAATTEQCQSMFFKSSTKAGCIAKMCGLSTPSRLNCFFFTLVFAVFVIFGMVFYMLEEPCSCSFGVTLAPPLPEAYRKLAPLCDDSSYDRCVATGGYVLSWIDTFYMSVITMTTIGFGDYCPRTKVGRVVSIFWMTFGCMSTGIWISSISSMLFAESEAGATSAAPAVAERLLLSLDVDQDGFLNRADSHIYYLLKSNVLSEELLKELDEKFDKVAEANSKGLKVVSLDQLCNKPIEQSDKTLEQSAI